MMTPWRVETCGLRYLIKYSKLCKTVLCLTDHPIQLLATGWTVPGSNLGGGMDFPHTIIYINYKWVDTKWQWSFYILHMHGL
jgi:hypothetical protein